MRDEAISSLSARLSTFNPRVCAEYAHRFVAGVLQANHLFRTNGSDWTEVDFDLAGSFRHRMIRKILSSEEIKGG